MLTMSPWLQKQGQLQAKGLSAFMQHSDQVFKLEHPIRNIL